MNGVVTGVVPYEIGGLPAHVLLIHLTVIIVPLAALATVIHATWPAARRRLGIVTPTIALVALVCVPITVSAGEWLMARVPVTPLIARHADLASGMLPWAIALFAVSAVNYAWFRFGVPRATPEKLDAEPMRQFPSAGDTATLTRSEVRTGAARTKIVVATVLAVVLAVVVGVGSVVQIYRVGEAGARAAWQGNFSEAPLHHS
ncbi:MAG: DUF2231 domain-containing protein [Sciscionella sp.]